MCVVCVCCCLLLLFVVAFTLQKESDDEEDMGIRRSGRARKTVDYTFKDFDEDINEAVEKDRKRFKPGSEAETNGCEAANTHGIPVNMFYVSGHHTRRSRRLRDLDDPSDSESKTSEYEYQGSSDDEGPKHPQRHVYLGRHVIEDEDEESGPSEENGTTEGGENKGRGEKNGEKSESKDNSEGEDTTREKSQSEQDVSQEDSGAENGNDTSSDRSGYSKTNTAAQPKTRTALKTSPAGPVSPADFRPQPVEKTTKVPSPLTDLSLYLTPDMCNKEEMFKEFPLESNKEDALTGAASQDLGLPSGHQGFAGANYDSRGVGYGMADPIAMKSPGQNIPTPTSGPPWVRNSQYSGTYGLPGFSRSPGPVPNSPVGNQGFASPVSPSSSRGFTPPVPNSPGSNRGFPSAIPNSPGTSRAFPPPSYSQAIGRYAGERSQYANYNQTYAQPPGLEPSLFPPQPNANQFRDTGYYSPPPPQPQPYSTNRTNYFMNNQGAGAGATPVTSPWTFPEGGMYNPGAGVGTNPLGQKYG